MDTNENCYHFLLPDEIGRSQRRLVHSAHRRLVSAADTLLHWLERASQRRRLAALDAYMLKDIGLGRADADRESSKWFWQD